jgi:hypothetical protein
MDFHNSTRVEPLAFGEALDRAAVQIADDLTAGLSGAVREALQDPLTMALMKADKVDANAVADMLRRMSASLAAPPSRPCYRC